MPLLSYLSICILSDYRCIPNENALQLVQILLQLIAFIRLSKERNEYFFVRNRVPHFGLHTLWNIFHKYSGLNSNCKY